MTETLGQYNISDREVLLRSADRVLRPQAKLSFEAQLETLPLDVRSVAESLALRDLESAKSYVEQYLSVNRRVKS